MFGGSMPLFCLFLYFITFIQFNHPITFIQYIRRGLTPSPHRLWLSGKERPPCGAEPGIELGTCAFQQADALPTEPRRTIPTEPRRTVKVNFFANNSQCSNKRNQLRKLINFNAREEICQISHISCQANFSGNYVFTS